MDTNFIDIGPYSSSASYLLQRPGYGRAKMMPAELRNLNCIHFYQAREERFSLQYLKTAKKTVQSLKDAKLPLQCLQPTLYQLVVI